MTTIQCIFSIFWCNNSQMFSFQYEHYPFSSFLIFYLFSFSFSSPLMVILELVSSYLVLLGHHHHLPMMDWWLSPILHKHSRHLLHLLGLDRTSSHHPLMFCIIWVIRTYKDIYNYLTYVGIVHCSSQL